MLRINGIRIIVIKQETVMGVRNNLCKPHLRDGMDPQQRLNGWYATLFNDRDLRHRFVHTTAMLELIIMETLMIQMAESMA